MLLRTKHISLHVETKGTIQIRWDRNEWPGILQSSLNVFLLLVLMQLHCSGPKGFSWVFPRMIACIADELNLGIVCLRISDQKLVLPRVLPWFSIIGFDWLLHMAVLCCTMIGWVDLVEPWLCSRWIPDTENKCGGNLRIRVWTSEKQFEQSDNLPEQQEYVKVFWGQWSLC